MKLLIVGMDGGHLDAYRRGWTPYFAKLLDRADHAPINEDLVSRGWSKIITGEPGSVTGAIYDRPELNGTHQWSLNFNLADIPGIGDTVNTLWHKLGADGWKVGIMNVPTVFPAPEVNGFFVSGGGGGGPVLQDPTKDMCYPHDILSYLLEMGYIVDERLGSMLAEKKIYNSNSFFQRYAQKNAKRTEAFVKLSRRFKIDFGFVVYKSSSNIAEFLLLPELASMQIEGRMQNSEMTESIIKYYRAFDIEIKTLREAFPDAELLFVSDHGMAAREFSFNPNKLLQALDLQKPSKQKRKIFDVIQFAKKLIPYSLRVVIRNNKHVKKAYESIITFDSARSRAFSTMIGDWRHGIFVNDQKRFGGPVPVDQIEKVKTEIVDRINAYSDAQNYGIYASRRPDPSGAPEFPDVVLNVPDGFISSNDSDTPFEQFKLPPGPHTISTVTEGALLCGKSSKALAAVVGAKWSYKSDKRDLTLVHHHVLESFHK